MSLRRAEWSWPAYDPYRTSAGLLLDLRRVCPCDVSAMLQADAQAVLCAAWTSKPGLEQFARMPLLEPIRQVLRQRHSADWTSNAANAAGGTRSMDAAGLVQHRQS